MVENNDNAASPPGGKSRADDFGQHGAEPSIHEQEGLPPDTVILDPARPAPMEAPAGTWAMLVLALHLAGEEVRTIAGTWLVGEIPAQQYDGDLAVRLSPTTPSANGPRVDVELWQSYEDEWHRLGQQLNQDTGWPAALAPIAAEYAHQYVRTIEDPPAGPRRMSECWNRSRVRDLIEAGLLAVGDQLHPPQRRNQPPEAAHVGPDGLIVLPDGRSFIDPTSAATAVCGYHRNGWNAFWHTSNGRPLGHLLADFHDLRNATLARLSSL